jgi:pyruvate/2-oxoglutarate dehydrogenase complex dihydrolipoamide acyltransferase (E2) component
MTTKETIILIPTEIVNDTEVTLARWLRANNTYVTQGEEIAFIETSKMNSEIVAPASGYLKHLCKDQIDIAVGAQIGAIYDNLNAEIITETITTAQETSGTQQAQFSKKAEKLLSEHSLAPSLFQHLTMVTEQDVLTYLQTGTATSVTLNDMDNKIKLSRTKRTEIENLSAAKKQAIKSTVSTMLHYRKTPAVERFLNENRIAVLVFEIGRLLTQFQELNCYYEAGFLQPHAAINIAIAMDGEPGLKTPTLVNIDRLSFSAIQHALRELLLRYINNELTEQDFSPASFTITDLSGEDVFYFDPLLSHRQACILGIGAALELPQYEYNLTSLILSFDHQVTAGKRAAEFLAKLKHRYLAHIESCLEQNENANPIACNECHKTLATLQQQGSKLLSHYIAPNRAELICSTCLRG